MKKSKANILVVEDDPSILEGLLDVLIFNGFSAQGVENGLDGLHEALTGRYDLLLLDVMLPGMDGFSLCEKVRRELPNQAIVLLTAKGDEADILTGFKAGADDYVSKPFSIRELMVRVEAVLRRIGKRVGDEEISYLGCTFTGKTLHAACSGKDVELTRREMDIISYLYINRDRIVSRKELLEKVWQYHDVDIDTRTVDIHILKLRKKIAELTDAPFIATVRGEGYRLEPES
ncbi:MAG: response regulator transcription factor [Proteobacteria bacterium]|nr:response regulator transcription factor [Pseudomonadota bacterium]